MDGGTRLVSKYITQHWNTHFTGYRGYEVRSNSSCQQPSVVPKYVVTHGVTTSIGKAAYSIPAYSPNPRGVAYRVVRAQAEGAGTPAISDPGSDLVAAALASGHRVSPIPGPSALSSAVSASGLIDGPFLSLGFLPRERVDRRKTLARAAASGLPLVIFESARRLESSLGDLREALGDRQAVMMRELTKIHEEVRAATLSELAVWSANVPPRGEVVLVCGRCAGHERVAD